MIVGWREVFLIVSTLSCFGLLKIDSNNKDMVLGKQVGKKICRNGQQILSRLKGKLIGVGNSQNRKNIV